MTLHTYNQFHDGDDKQNEQSHHDASWSNQFWPWFIIFVLVSTVLAGVVTIYLAVSHDDSLVVDNYYKEGLAINRVLTQKQNAVKQGVIANLSISVDKKSLILDLPAEITEQNKLIKMRMVHITLSSLDRVHFLKRDNDSRYRLPASSLEDGRWKIIIEPVDGSWLLEQQIQMPVKSVITIEPRE